MGKVLVEPKIHFFHLRDSQKSFESTQKNADPAEQGGSLLEQDVALFDKAQISSFSLSEQISHPYKACVEFYTLTECKLHDLDLDNLLIRVIYGVNEDSVNQQSSIVPNGMQLPRSGLIEKNFDHYLWGLVSDIVYQGCKLFISGDKKETRYYYKLEICSPLDKMSSSFSWKNFFNQGLDNILEKILIEENGVLAQGVGAFFKLDLSALKDVERFKFSRLLLQQGPQSDFDFLNRLLIDNGVNYVFDHRKEGVALIFSDTLAFSDFWNKTDEQGKARYCNQDLNGYLIKEHTHQGNMFVDDFTSFKHARSLIREELGYAYLFPEEGAASRNATYALVMKQTERNHERRRARFNEGCSLRVHGEIGVRAGGKLFLHSEDLVTVKSIFISSTELKIDESLYGNPVTISLHGIELHGEIDGERVGSFAPLPKQSVSSVTTELLAATVCSADGKTDQSIQLASEEQCLGQDLFYAKLEQNGHLVVAHVGRGRTNGIKIPRCGTFVMLLRNGGRFYLHSLCAQNLLSNTEKLSGINEELAGETVFNSGDTDKFSVSKNLDSKSDSFGYCGSADMRLGRFVSNVQYVVSLLARGEQEIGRLIYQLSVERNNSDLYDVSYVKKYQPEIKETIRKYREFKRNYEQVLRDFRKDSLELKIDEADPEINDANDPNHSKYQAKINDLIQSKQYSVKHELIDGQGKLNIVEANITLANIESSFKQAESQLYELANKIVTDFSISFIAEGEHEKGRSELSLRTSDALCFNADGDLTIHAKNINIIAEGKISTHAKDEITEYSSKGITQNAGGSSIALKLDGASIFAPAAYSGKNVAKVYRNSSLLGSSLNVKSYSGVTAAGFNVNLSATNYVQIKDSVSAGIKLGYGEVSITGGKVGVGTAGTRDMAVGIAKFTSTFISDLSTSLAAKDKNGVAIKDAVMNTAYTALDDVVSGVKFYNSFKQAKNKYDSNQKRIDSISAIEEDQRTDAEKEELASAQRKRGELYYNYVMAIIAAINFTLDRIYDVCKVVYTSMKIDADCRKLKNNERNPYITPFENSSMSKLDQIRLYITYEKTLCSLISAGYIAYKGARGFLKPSLASLSMTSTAIKVEGDQVNLIGKETDLSQTVLAGVSAANIRNLVQGNNP